MITGDKDASVSALKASFAAGKGDAQGMRTLAIFICAISPFLTMAETHQLDKEKSTSLLEGAAREGINLPVPNTLSDQVGVTAVLLTKSAVGRLFGKDIANT